tara:strand:- start:321 stop:797 length:477 start_codon:yes stop_codon:yes gene_type:complete
MAWEQLATYTLDPAGSYMELAGFDAKNWLYLLGQFRPDSSINANLTFNGDTGSNYAVRRLFNAIYPANFGNDTSIEYQWDSGDFPVITETYIWNSDSNAKQTITRTADAGATGAGNVPNYSSTVGKWEDNAQVTTLRMTDGDASNYAVGSSLTLWGTD